MLFCVCLPLSLRFVCLHTQTWWIKHLERETQTLRTGCSKAEPKIFTPLQTPFLVVRDSQNLISWRWSLPLPTNPVWWGSMHAISSYGNRPTNKHTHPQTHMQTHRQDQLQYTAPQLASMQCNYHMFKMSAFITYACIEWCTPLVNGCVVCPLLTNLHCGSCDLILTSMHALPLSVCLSLRFNARFPGGPGLSGTRMSPFWILLELRVMEVVVITGAISRAKLQSNCHHWQMNTQFLFTGRMPFLSPNQQCQKTEGKLVCLIYLI